MKKKITKKINEKEILLSGITFVVGTFLLALCYNLFFVPNKWVVGGVSGLAIVLSEVTGMSEQVFVYVLSIALIGVCYIFLGKDETKRVVVGSLLYPLFVTFTAPIARFMLTFLSFNEVLVTVALASILYGVSGGIIYKYGHSTGGIDVLVRIFYKYLGFSEGKGLIVINIFIILAGVFMFGVNNATYAAIILVISSVIVDKISIGISDAKKFMIYTKLDKKINKVITDEFKAGYTIFPTIGGYSHSKGSMIMCVIRNRDINSFKARITEIDPDAFFVVSDCYEVQGGVRRSNLPFME